MPEPRSRISRRSVLGATAGLAAARAVPAKPLPPVPGKVVYISFMLHGNMCYDRYTKQEIRAKFPRIYATGVRALARHPEVTAHIDFPGLTLLSLKQYAPGFLDELKPLVDRGQVVMAGCQYAASHALCSDEESDLVAGRLTMEILRRELQPQANTFFPQEIVFHPQMPYIMNQIGVRRLIAMPDGWQRPRRVEGIDGSSVIVYPVDHRRLELGKLEQYYDSHPDGSFVMNYADFEQLGDIDAFVDEIAQLAAKGKAVHWTTVDRYEKEIGVIDRGAAPHPFGQAEEDRESSPSFSRWVSHPDDAIWHGHAVQALDAIRAAGFAQAAAALHNFGPVNVPLKDAWTAAPDNAWDSRFEEPGEFPQTETDHLGGGPSTLLSRAWHDLLVGLNSDSSGWFPWSPRTRHRELVLDSSRALSNEILERFARELAARIATPRTRSKGYVLALNPAPARTAEVRLDVAGPLGLVDADGSALPGGVELLNGEWTASARIDLPGYGYRLLGLQEQNPVAPQPWTPGNEVVSGGKRAALARGRLLVAEGEQQIEIAVTRFRLSDPSGAAAVEEVKPDWSRASTRVRHSVFGDDLEVFTELAWAVWLRTVIGLRPDRVEVAADVYVDMPRRIGRLGYNPEGLLLEFRGRPGRVLYDVPYATIEHKNPEPSYVAAQRFAAIDAGPAAFGIVALGGDQSFRVSAREGIVAASLGASIQGRADTRPQCILLPNGYARHEIASGGDPFFGSYEHRFALLFRPAAEMAIAAGQLRIAAPVFHAAPGGGNWPVQQSLIALHAPAARATAFRSGPDGCSVVINDLSGATSEIACSGDTATLPAFGIRTIRLTA